VTELPDFRLGIAAMAAAVLIEEQIEIPAICEGLSEFRRWATSDEFPETGRIDFIAGRIEVEMSPEDLHTQGTPKTELIVIIGRRVREAGLGELYTDRTHQFQYSAVLNHWYRLDRTRNRHGRLQYTLQERVGA